MWKAEEEQGYYDYGRGLPAMPDSRQQRELVLPDYVNQVSSFHISKLTSVFTQF